MSLAAALRPSAVLRYCAPDIEDLRLAFEAMCDADFGDADIDTMTSEASRRMALLEAEAPFDRTGGAALQATMLRELVALATGRDVRATLH